MNDIGESMMPPASFSIPKGKDRTNRLLQAQQLQQSIYENNIRIASFVSGPDSPPTDMHETPLGSAVHWGTYGRGNQGACLAFSKRELAITLERLAACHQETARARCKHGPIKYIPTGTPFPAKPTPVPDEAQPHEAWVSQTLDHTAGFASSIGFMKSGEWAWEKEWRLLFTSLQPGPVMMAVHGSLRAVIAGCRATIPELSILNLVASSTGVPMYRMGKSAGSSRYNLHVDSITERRLMSPGTGSTEPSVKRL